MSDSSKRLFHGRKEPRTKLEWALNALALGYRVFPCAPGGRNPLGLWSDWPDIKEPADQVKAWWECHPDANIGAELFDTQKWIGGSVEHACTVLCIDGRRGASLAWFDIEYGDLPCGRVVAAPDGVLHIHMHGLTASCVDRFGPGYDVRSINDYVLLPGSQIGGCEYAWHRLNKSPGTLGIPRAPDWFISAAGRPTEREHGTGWDSEFEVQQAQSFLGRAKPARIIGEKFTMELKRAIEGLAKHHITEQTAVGLLAARYAPRCQTDTVMDRPNDVLRAAVSSVYRELKCEPLPLPDSSR